MQKDRSLRFFENFTLTIHHTRHLLDKNGCKLVAYPRYGILDQDTYTLHHHRLKIAIILKILKLSEFQKAVRLLKFSEQHHRD